MTEIFPSCKLQGTRGCRGWLPGEGTTSGKYSAPTEYPATEGLSRCLPWPVPRVLCHGLRRENTGQGQDDFSEVAGSGDGRAESDMPAAQPAAPSPRVRTGLGDGRCFSSNAGPWMTNRALPASVPPPPGPCESPGTRLAGTGVALGSPRAARRDPDLAEPWVCTILREHLEMCLFRETRARARSDGDRGSDSDRGTWPRRSHP